MNKIRIQVKEKHIQDGTPENCQFCAVALAIDEKLSSMFKLDFLPSIVEKGNSDYALKLSDNKPSPYQTEFTTQISMEDQETVNDFVFDYDAGKDVEPFDFNLEINNFQIERMKKLEKQEGKFFDEWEKKRNS